ncbi:4-diphosphocytidyl-2-C-methyl-D-erythritol kinase [Nitrosomonas cryotolerans]|uniref:4-diphosphocytidyl-2-C-methyl-D-erythritol kinase n=1 Tax=Nitrosomonas cryotolerans ATCC 49181 TaxID=1131553 RepID=A0A1N6FA35_9PROT|nr:4-(cytidine 5'-diphospho)-2-C-methyl-D-erythritol kinase [Nitrosomonas cryotolerans]SFP74807.1 4-diphosphocytidyl-2-C-methyl-D-erythritol kinase [Nitrosomonas cryotolerans]SIN92141.1 4-diphosphocytidyl-2-C-methyl-D-erythritol kinase [Nitrosomonas cryotolerans ATCC 49181]
MLTLPAPAKLNLFLHVIGRRHDGYHLLQTVFRFLDFSDELSFELRKDSVIKLHMSTAIIPEEENLCVRAAKLLQQESGAAQGVDIFLKKQIPMGGGLGGGSSDAATTLLALNQLWGLGWEKNGLMKLGVKLGADVPVFIFGRSAFAEGIGEKLAPIELPSAWYLVLVPSVQISTAKIFASKELTRNTIPIKIPHFPIWQGHNDLESVVCRAYPEVANYLEWLKQLDNTTIVRMSGSGSCVFAEFATEIAAKAAVEQIPAGINGFIAQGLNRHPMCISMD